MDIEVLQSRKIALDILVQVLYKNQNLDDEYDRLAKDLSHTDKAFVRMLTTTCLRRLGQIDTVLEKLLEKPLPFKARMVQNILRLAVCQILFMQVPAHAAVSTAVDLTKLSKLDFYTKLVNGVLRNLCRAPQSFTATDETLNTPKWLYDSWVKAYGNEKARMIAIANLTQPATYITVKENPKHWATLLGATVNATGSVKLPDNVYIPDLAGFAQGAWWVQDAAAAMPVMLFDDLKGKKTADFCAAPGGKTACLIKAGALVDAFDISEKRMKRVKENLDRLHYSADLKVMDANKAPEDNLYDAILIDAPCSATGTIRRHPDLYFHRSAQDVANLNAAQLKLLKTAHRLLKPAGHAVYCTCSLQPQEGEDIIKQVLNLFDVLPITNPLLKPFVQKSGFIRTFPDQDMDGFFMALLQKK